MAGVAMQFSYVDRATPAVRATLDGLHPAHLNPIIGRSARNLVFTHLRDLDAKRANKLGGQRTNFYASAANATQFRVEGDYVIVSINQVGIGLRYFGGIVKPKTKKYLTIPAAAEAHGKRASDFPDLKFALVPDPKSGHLRPALVRRGANELSVIRIVRAQGRNVVRRADQSVAYVLFWLVEQTTHKADPSVLPTQAQLNDHIGADLEQYARTLWARQQKGNN